jgi:hypothetical protein
MLSSDDRDFFEGLVKEFNQLTERRNIGGAPRSV